MTDEPTHIGGLPRSPWTVADLIKAALLVVLLVVASVVIVLGAGLALRLAGIHIDNTRPLIAVSLTVMQDIAFVISVWVFGVRKYGGGFERLGLRPYAAGSGCSYAAFALFLSFGFNALYSVVLTGGNRQVQPTQILSYFGGGLAGFALALTFGALIAPFAEEIFFRGFLFPGLARRFGFLLGALFSAILFGAIHQSVDSFIPLSFFGLVLALLYAATGSLYPGIVMHSVNNTIALLAAYFLESGFLQQ